MRRAIDASVPGRSLSVDDRPPSLTYGETLIPLAVNSWQKSYTIVGRMLRGEKVIVPGDGSSLWVITHNSDFAKGLIGLLGNEQTIGHAFHITSDEA